MTQKKDTIYLWICISKHYSILCLSSQYKPKNTKPKQFPRIPKNIFATNTTKRNSLIANFSLKLHCKKRKIFLKSCNFHTKSNKTIYFKQKSNPISLHFHFIFFAHLVSLPCLANWHRQLAFLFGILVVICLSCRNSPSCLAFLLILHKYLASLFANSLSCILWIKK